MDLQDSDEEEDAAPHEHFQRYCRDVEGTAAWGGDLELNALSRALKRHFVVHSAGLPAVELGTEHKGGCQAPLWTCCSALRTPWSLALDVQAGTAR